MDASHSATASGKTGTNQVLELDLIALFQDQVEGLSVRELSEKTGKTVHQVRHILRGLVVAGKVEHVGFKNLPNLLDGRLSSVPVYRMKET